MAHYPFVLRGRIEADSREEAQTRVLRMLKLLGFADVGDGSLWLDRPRDAHDDVGIALAEMTAYVDEVEAGEAAS